MDKKKATITGDLLKAQATRFWRILLQYVDQEEPKWSNSWLGGFKARFKIKEYVIYREGGSAAIDLPDAIKQMDGVRALCAKYKYRNILNMDKTGLN
jgi:hypothetical protein